MKRIYRVHLNGGDQDFSTKKAAFRQARNIAGALAGVGSKSEGVWVTPEDVDDDHPTVDEKKEAHDEADHD